MPLQNITLTASINSIASQSYGQRTYVASTDEQSFPIEKITGSYAGVWPDFKLRNLNSIYSASNTTVNLIVNVTQSWSDSNITPLGLVSSIHDTMEEFVNGEFSGSEYVVTDGNLTDEDCQQFLTANTQPVEYSIFPYVTEFNVGSQTITYDSFPEFFHRYTVPEPGQILIHIYQTLDAPNYTRNITYAKIARIDQLGNDNTFSLQELTSLKWTDSNVGEIILTVTNITEYQNYYLYEVTSDTFSSTSGIFIGDDNVLDYTLLATNSPVVFTGYNYFTSSWSVVTDNAGGFNASRGYYSFPLTPNTVTQFTASIDLTLTTPATFSYAINAYDPIYPKIIPNAIYSINSPLQFNTYSQSAALNVFFLNAGTHTLTISGSGFQYDFIQNYEHRIDAYLENNNIALGENGELSGSINDFTPNNWESVVSGSAVNPISWTVDSAGEGWVTSKYFAGDNIGKYGVIYTPNSYNEPSVLRIPNGIGAEFPWVNGTTYRIDIYIPPSFQFENLGIFGPSLAPLTCSTSLTNPLAPANIIGYIPSGASGVISFTRTAIAADDNFNIIAPLNAADTSNQIFPLVEWIKVYNSSSALADISLRINQPQSPENATSSIILEPYLPANFNYTDCDVLMNNYSQNDTSEYVRRVNYDFGSTIPSNLEQIISGTAEFAEVNDYLYTLSANRLPRYEGVRVSQQTLNTWTLGDVSPSQTPSVQNLKTSVAYSEKVIDSAPIVMNASRAIVKLLINENGESLTPNADSNTVYIVQGNFMSEENLIINSVQENLLNNNNSISSQYKTIIRGGYRPVPILYNQVKDPTNAPMTWEDFIYFTDDNPLSSTTVQDFTATLKPLNNSVAAANTVPSGLFMNSIISQGDDITTELTANANSYTVSQNVLDEGVDLVFEAKINLSRFGGISSTVRGSIIRERGGNIDRYFIYNSTPITVSPNGTTLTIQGTVSATNLQLGDRFLVGIQPSNNVFYLNSSTFKITTIPLPTPAISSSGLFQITSSLPPDVPGQHYNYIFTTSSLLLQYFNNDLVHQEDIDDSLFEPVTLPFTLQPGDQFRFEGDENKVFEVKSYTEATASNGSGSLFIEFTNQISGSGCDINKFLLRRYIPDAQSIVFQNLTDKEASGVILTPEYVTTKLNDNIDTYITDLTNKSLI